MLCLSLCNKGYIQRLHGLFLTSTFFVIQGEVFSVEMTMARKNSETLIVLDHVMLAEKREWGKIFLSESSQRAPTLP